MKTIDGKLIAQMIKANVKKQIEEKIEGQNVLPTLACILVGDNPASQVYVRQKEKACAECGIESRIYRLKEDCTKDDIKTTIMMLNKHAGVSGILLQLPLPEHLSEYQDELINTIDPTKDVDCLTNNNLGKLFASNGATHRIAPCTATGIIKILDSENYDLNGKNVVVIGRSLLVGKSVSMLLQQRNATVTMCHSHTQNLKDITSKADVLVVAIGKPNFITQEYIKPGAFVIDVGINRTENGLVGDVDFANVVTKCDKITPVPGGVGPMTVACLMENTLTLYEDAPEV